MRTTLVLFHQNKYFSHAFFSLVSDKYKRNYEIISFSNLESLVNYLNANINKSIFIVSEYENLKQLDFNNIVKIATSNYSNFIYRDEIYYLNIYQSGDDIVNDIEKIVVSINPEKINIEFDSKNNISCFFSSQGGSGVSTIGYMTAVGLSKIGKTLYFNLEQLGYTDKLYSNPCTGDIYDLIVSTSSKIDCTQNIITLAAKNSHGVYVMPKFRSMGELYTLNIDDYGFLIDNICNCGYFDYIILDLMHGINEINEMIFSKCNNIFAVYTSDVIGSNKMNNLMNDPFMRRFDFYARIKYILNKCENKVNDEIYSSVFPISQSTANGSDIGIILNKNQDISESVDKLTKIIMR